MRGRLPQAVSPGQGQLEAARQERQHRAASAALTEVALGEQEQPAASVGRKEAGFQERQHRADASAAAPMAVLAVPRLLPPDHRTRRGDPGKPATANP